MSSFPYSDKSATEVEDIFEKETKSGFLSNYLLDPQDYFLDKATGKLTESLVRLLTRDYKTLAD